MRVSYSAAAERFREEIERFLAANLPEDWRGVGTLEGQDFLDFRKRWRRTLHEHRLLAPAWPESYGGRGLSAEEQVVLAEVFALAGVPDGSASDEISIGMLGNTLLDLGSEEQKEHYLPRILSGEIVFCQGYSEPNAGSDLANLATRAELRGDEWVINGQKTWTSEAVDSNWVFILARTDPASKRHRGLTFLLVPLDQPGIELRPIQMINGQDGFCEVFLTDARTSAESVVGEVGEGWKVGLHLLNHERGQAAVTLPIRFQAELDRLMELARSRGLLGDPVMRQRLAWCCERVHAMRLLGWRAVSRWIAGEQPGPESSAFKLHWSEYHGVATQLAMDILGSEGLVTEGRAPQGEVTVTDEVGAANSTASWQGISLNALSETIWAGTSEVQRSIIGERVLGLPREPRPGDRPGP
jgi:alkylation response protein AidB-like acyl-CoA dehydrogenase